MLVASSGECHCILLVKTYKTLQYSLYAACNCSPKEIHNYYVQTKSLFIMFEWSLLRLAPTMYPYAAIMLLKTMCRAGMGIE